MVMDLNNSRLTVVQNQANYGLYAWKLPDGKLFKDEYGNILNIPSIKYDFEKMAQLRNAADYYGQPEGEPVWLGGVGRATEEEYEEDMQRIKEGLIPLGDTEAWRDAARAQRQLDNRYQD